MKVRKILEVALGILTVSCPLGATVVPNALFSDHAVLQRHHAIPVWGTATPASAIDVRLGTVEMKTVTDAKGSWRLVLPAMEAGGPYSLHITGDGGEVELRDIMVGEVWLAAGQSNMAFALKSALDGSEAIAASENVNIRMFRVHAARTDDPTVPQTTIGGEWQLANPHNAPEFSAVAWFFAKRLQEALHVPVGIINNSVGGSPAEAWTSRETLASDPALASVMHADLQRLHDAAGKEEQYTKDLAAWEDANHTKDPGGSAALYVADDVDSSAWKKASLPAKPAGLGLKAGAVVWFRRDVTVQPDQLESETSVHFGKLGESCSLYVNGVRVGNYGGVHNAPRADVTFTFASSYFRPGVNTLALRVFAHTMKTEDLGSAEPSLSSGKTKIALGGPWAYKVSYEGTPLNDAAQKSFPTYTAINMSQVSILLYDQLLVPLSDYAIRGVLWYQGEQNLTDPALYRLLLPKMIADWRRQWHEDLPFYLVQLPNLGLASAGVKGHLPLIRAVQADTANSIGNSGYVVTIDVGDSRNIHPTNKHPVGDRLASLALGKTYGMPVVWSGPTPASVTHKGHAIQIQFVHADGGLVAKNGPLGGFMIAGHDHVFAPAVATLHGDQVDVSSAQVSDPEVVVYAWADNPTDANLYNGAGLPAAPFTTDRLALP